MDKWKAKKEACETHKITIRYKCKRKCLKMQLWHFLLVQSIFLRFGTNPKFTFTTQTLTRKIVIFIRTYIQCLLRNQDKWKLAAVNKYKFFSFLWTKICIYFKICTFLSISICSHNIETFRCYWSIHFRERKLNISRDFALIIGFKFEPGSKIASARFRISLLLVNFLIMSQEHLAENIQEDLIEFARAKAD